MSKESKLLSVYLKQKQIRALKELMPQVFNGDKLNLNQLKSYLGSDGSPSKVGSTPQFFLAKQKF
nr:hypothetical protein [uncultured Marinifilum sp.]